MRIAHLASEYPPQEVFGLGRYVHDLAVAQAGSGHSVHVVTNSIGGRDRDAQSEGVRVHRVNFPPPPKPHLETAAVCQFNSLLLERLPEVSVTHGPFDVVNSHDWLTAVAGHEWARLSGSAHVWTVHDLVIHKRGGKLTNEDVFTANVERWASARADHVICNSMHVRDELLEHYGAVPRQVSVVHCAVDPGRFDITMPRSHRPYFRRAFASDDERIVLYVGRLDREKGLGVLLRAAEIVAASSPSVSFVLAGRGELEKQIGSDIAHGELKGRVKLPGYVGEPALTWLYKVADIQVVPSLYEPFGIVALEGMVSGLPVVASDTGGLSEIIADGVDGRTFPVGDHRALASILKDLLSDPAERASLGDHAAKKAVSAYSWRAAAEAVDAVYSRAAVRRQAEAVGTGP